jgi:hypothetical protein
VVAIAIETAATDLKTEDIHVISSIGQRRILLPQVYEPVDHADHQRAANIVTTITALLEAGRRIAASWRQTILGPLMKTGNENADRTQNKPDTDNTEKHLHERLFHFAENLHKHGNSGDEHH